MPRKGDIVYALEQTGYVPVTVVEVKDTDRQAPDGEVFSDTLVTVRDQDGRTQSDYASHFNQIPFLAEIENLLEAQVVPNKNS